MLSVDGTNTRGSDEILDNLKKRVGGSFANAFMAFPGLYS